MSVWLRLRITARLAPLVILGLGGCDVDQLPQPSAVPGQAPDTKEAIQAEVEAGLQPLYDYVGTLTRQTPLPPGFAEQSLAYLQGAVSKYSGTPAGQEALHAVERHLEDTLRQARDAQNGLAVLMVCSLIRAIEPGNPRLARHEEWATIEKNRPVVMLRGWYEDREADPPVVNAFIEVYLPETGEVQHLRVREGEEFLGLKFLKIIGKRRGMRLEYLKTGDLFEVYLRSWP
ncbi:MAG: hypothetical protein IT364_10250 [Candidatus Hydrogenedentes bacterium]|nr:hypothetical protein [Candidatus Hydrogenedentota bacterium]